ncbi:hypothetical protein D3C81_2208880 [compost metagenome]
MDAATDALELFDQHIAVFARRIHHRDGHAAQVLIEAAKAMVHAHFNQNSSRPNAVR